MNLKRSNQQWLDQLRGQDGWDSQQQAHLNLANYLYIVAYNYLLKRQPDVGGLAEYERQEIAAMAQDYVQDVMENIARADFALLSKYHGAGAFTAWAAVVLRNHIAGALRTSAFTRKSVNLDSLQSLPTEASDAATNLGRAEVIAALQDCLAQLSHHYRISLVRCIGEGEAAQSVADALQKSAGAINLLVMRAKRQVKTCLARKGYGPEALGML